MPHTGSHIQLNTMVMSNRPTSVSVRSEENDQELLKLIVFALLLRDLTPDVCSCIDISSIREKKKWVKEMPLLDQLFSRA